jgi:hypothetical protein
MFKVRVLSKRLCCNGEAYLPLGQTEDCQSHKYIRHIPCPTCEGRSNLPSWISLDDFAKLIYQADCSLEPTFFRGNMRFIEGDIWDGLTDVCDDCGG